MHGKCVLADHLLSQSLSLIDIAVSVVEKHVFLGAEQIARVFSHQRCQVPTHLEILFALCVASV